MEFTDLLITIGTALGILIIGFILGNRLKKKGIINEEVFDFTNQLFTLVKIITVKTLDEKHKDRAIEIFETIQGVLNYVYVTIETENIEDKKALAKEQILLRLNDFNIDVDDQDILLIDLIVENFIKFLPTEK